METVLEPVSGLKKRRSSSSDDLEAGPSKAQRTPAADGSEDEKDCFEQYASLFRKAMQDARSQVETETEMVHVAMRLHEPAPAGTLQQAWSAPACILHVPDTFTAGDAMALAACQAQGTFVPRNIYRKATRKDLDDAGELMQGLSTQVEYRIKMKDSELIREVVRSADVVDPGVGSQEKPLELWVSVQPHGVGTLYTACGYTSKHAHGLRINGVRGVRSSIKVPPSSITSFSRRGKATGVMASATSLTLPPSGHGTLPIPSLGLPAIASPTTMALVEALQGVQQQAAAHAAAASAGQLLLSLGQQITQVPPDDEDAGNTKETSEDIELAQGDGHQPSGGAPLAPQGPLPEGGVPPDENVNADEELTQDGEDLTPGLLPPHLSQITPEELALALSSYQVNLQALPLGRQGHGEGGVLSGLQDTNAKDEEEEEAVAMAAAMASVHVPMVANLPRLGTGKGRGKPGKKSGGVSNGADVGGVVRGGGLRRLKSEATTPAPVGGAGGAEGGGPSTTGGDGDGGGRMTRSAAGRVMKRPARFLEDEVGMDDSADEDYQQDYEVEPEGSEDAAAAAVAVTTEADDEVQDIAATLMQVRAGRAPARQPGQRRQRVKYTDEEIHAILDGLLRLTEQQRESAWATIKREAGIVLTKRSNVDLKDKWRNLQLQWYKNELAAELAAKVERVKRKTDHQGPWPADKIW